MIFKMNELETLVWLNPSRGGLFEVRVGQLKVTPGLREENAQRIAKRIRDNMVRGAREEILRVAKASCVLCRQDNKVLKVKTPYGIRLLHEVASMGFQSCESEEIWREVLLDAAERENRIETFWTPDKTTIQDVL